MVTALYGNAARVVHCLRDSGDDLVGNAIAYDEVKIAIAGVYEFLSDLVGGRSTVVAAVIAA